MRSTRNSYPGRTANRNKDEIPSATRLTFANWALILTVIKSQDRHTPERSYFHKITSDSERQLHQPVSKKIHSLFSLDTSTLRKAYSICVMLRIPLSRTKKRAIVCTSSILCPLWLTSGSTLFTWSQKIPKHLNCPFRRRKYLRNTASIRMRIFTQLQSNLHSAKTVLTLHTSSGFVLLGHTINGRTVSVCGRVRAYDSVNRKVQQR